MKRIFCVTAYIINQENKFVMLHHKKLGKWVPPGGKIEPEETPEEAVLRECFEETGLSIRLIGSKSPVDGGLHTPYGMQLNTIIPLERDHVDLIYFGKPVEKEDLHVAEREASAIGWFSYEEVKKLDTFPSVIQWCRFFHSLVRKQRPMKEE
jgi:8-oxo-dGTP pyrophosphatase MutT (NUDIX family)